MMSPHRSRIWFISSSLSYVAGYVIALASVLPDPPILATVLNNFSHITHQTRPVSQITSGDCPWLPLSKET